jgi:hypothetical protein
MRRCTSFFVALPAAARAPRSQAALVRYSIKQLRFLDENIVEVRIRKRPGRLGSRDVAEGFRAFQARVQGFDAPRDRARLQGNPAIADGPSKQKLSPRSPLMHHSAALCAIIVAQTDMHRRSTSPTRASLRLPGCKGEGESARIADPAIRLATIRSDPHCPRGEVDRDRRRITRPRPPSDRAPAIAIGDKPTDPHSTH